MEETASRPRRKSPEPQPPDVNPRPTSLDVELLTVQRTDEVQMTAYIYAGALWWIAADDPIPAGARRVFLEKFDGHL